MRISQAGFLCRDYAAIIAAQRQDKPQCRNERKDGAVDEAQMFFSPRSANMDISFLLDFLHSIQLHAQSHKTCDHVLCSSDQFVSISTSRAKSCLLFAHQLLLLAAVWLVFHSPMCDARTHVTARLICASKHDQTWSKSTCPAKLWPLHFFQLEL